MKYLFLFIAAVFMIACNSTDQQASGNNTNTDSLNKQPGNNASSSTTIEWIDSENQDLGKINKGQVVEITWRFRNTGDQPLVINNVSAGCGCTVADKPEEPIAPGKEGKITAKFDSRSQPAGTNQKSVTVSANTKDKNAHYLTFKVDVVEK
jgi:Protein of unknown function (DUF1573)